MRTGKQQTGDLGEELACRFLRKKGFSIVERNYNRKWGEIDIIAKYGAEIHFVEVKSVTRENAGPRGHHPLENVHFRKQQRLKRAISSYMAEKRLDFKVPWKFDVAAVYISYEKRTGRVVFRGNIIL